MAASSLRSNGPDRSPGRSVDHGRLRTPTRTRFWKIALILSGLGASLAAGEAITRLVFARHRGISWYHYDDRYGWRHRSNHNVITTEWGDGDDWLFRTNRRGFRGDDWPDENPPDRFRVLVIGDSFTFGNAVDESEAFPKVAERILHRSELSYELLNLGVSAWGPSMALAYLETEGQPIEADCLIYGFFDGNDVHDNTSRRFFDRRNGELVRVPEGAQTAGVLGHVRRLARSLPLYDFLLERSQLFSVIRTAGMYALIHYHQPREERPEPNTFSVLPPATPEDLRLNDAIVERMAALSSERFGAFGIVLIPLREQLAASAGRPRIGFSVEDAENSRLHVREWAEEHHIPLIDLSDRLPHDAAATDPLYFKKDFHLSPAGHQRVGEVLAMEITFLCGASAISR